MFREMDLSIEDRQYTISARIIISGQDVVVVIGGGTGPHIGAVAVAYPEGEKWENEGGGISTFLVDVPGHREAELARESAERLAQNLGVTVVVCVGIHIDHATRDEIDILVDNFKRLITKVEKRLAQLIQ